MPGWRVLAALGFALLVAALAATPWGRRSETVAGGWLLHALAGPGAAPAEAVVLTLDRGSVDWLRFHAPGFERVPALGGCLGAEAREALTAARNAGDLPRGLHACLIEELARAGAGTIVFDILFARPTPDDARLAAAIAAAGRVLLFERIGQAAGPAGAAIRQSPRSPLAGAAAGTGFFLLALTGGDRTGAVRGYLGAAPGFPGLRPLPVLAAGREAGAAAAAGAGAVHPIRLYGPPGSLRHIPLRHAFDPDGPGLAPLDGASVFIGLSEPGDPGAPDHYAVAVPGAQGRSMAGVELLATAYLNLRRGEELRRPDPLSDAGLGFALALGLGALALRRPAGRSLPRAVLPLGAVAAGWLGAAALAFAHGLWLPVVLPVLVAGPLALLLLLAARAGLARRLVAALAPHQVAESLLSAPDPAPDVPRFATGEASVMFCDLIGSTALGERLGAEGYARLIEGYYDGAAAQIEAERGMVVEFTGDGILALFTALHAGPDHAARAAAAARRLCRWSAEPTADGTRLALRLSLHCGTVALGRIGARHRFSYKALGDAVTVAARIEQYARSRKDLAPPVVVLSEPLRRQAGLAAAEVDPLGPFDLAGRREPVPLFRLHSASHVAFRGDRPESSN